MKKQRAVDITLVEGSGGVFDVVLDGTLIFSKKELGRFPELDEILERIPA